MRAEIKIPFSADKITVQPELVKSLYGLPIVRLTAREFRVALTPAAAIEPGLALLDAGLPRQKDEQRRLN